MSALDGQWVVYGLISPRMGWLFYVGCTSRLSGRLAQHYSCQQGGATEATIREIRDEGLKPTHCVFGVFSDREAALDVERNLIRSIPELTNRQHSGEAMARVICKICGGDHWSIYCKRPAQKSAPVDVEGRAALAAKVDAAIARGELYPGHPEGPNAETVPGVIVSADPKEVKRKKPKSAIVALPSGKLEHTTLEPDPVVVVAHDDRVRNLPPESLARLGEAQAKKRGRPSTGYDKRKADRERARAKRAAAKAVKP